MLLRLPALPRTVERCCWENRNRPGRIRMIPAESAATQTIPIKHGGDYEPAVRLVTDVAATDSGSIADIYLKLDAANVATGASNVGTPWTYTVTYTIADL